MFLLFRFELLDFIIQRQHLGLLDSGVISGSVVALVNLPMIEFQDFDTFNSTLSLSTSLTG